jgi:hypothetical protein
VHFRRIDQRPRVSQGRHGWPALLADALPCRRDRHDRLERNVDQLWAEALVLYREMREEQPQGTLPLYLRDDEAQRSP